VQPETLLMRQINPSWIQNGRVTSQAFCPTAKDEGRLTVYDGDLIRPQASWDHFTQALGYSSAGVMAVTRAECLVEQLDVIEDHFPFPEHCSVDFSPFSNSEIKGKAKALSACARLRDWLYIPRTPAPSPAP
jgi:hypothetical protein